jgi:Zn finger protein HypA/HybF involved in hydrogenase expression
MEVTLYIPFANGDAVNGFSYEGRDIRGEEYAKMENDEYYNHKNGVDQMVVSSLGNNMAINSYDKRKINVKNQSYAFHKCDGNIRNINGTEVTITQLDRLWANKEQFALYIYLNEKQFMNKPDLETDFKMWVKDSTKILNISNLPDEEKLKHLPKKDFKMDIDNGKSHVVLKNCKFIKLLSNLRKPATRRCNVCGYVNDSEKKITEWICPKCGTTHCGEPLITSFGMIIERIIFTKN